MLRLVLIIVLLAVGVTHAQPAAQPATGQPASPMPSKLSIADLETMLGAIALYPDNLLANVLASSVYPLEIQKVHRYMSGGGKVEQLEKDGIEPPVQALAKVPDVLKMMNDNIEWAEALGQAYLLQAPDVMQAVQNLRAKAKANGVLQSGEQQTVVQEGSTIIIEQAQPDVIYVPSYDPQVVYVDHYDGGDVVAAGVIGFGLGVAVGAIWADHHCDWHGGYVGWGGGYADVDIDIDRGDINIDNSRINNINRNDLKNNNVSRNRAGQQGQPWKPNPAKASASNLAKPGGANAMQKYRGAGAGQLPAGTKLPNPKRDTPAAATRPSSGGPSRTPSAGNTAVRPSTPSRPSTPARPTAPARAPSAPARVPSAPASPARPSPQPSRPAPKAPSAPRAQPSRSSGFSNSPATRSHSSRGATSRGGGASRGGGRR